jgi:class 3 adenylate cyclase/tetratricopeptide (TPR) repeat protein
MAENRPGGPMRCPSCNHEPPSRSSFCNRCGSPLIEVPVLGERRQLTVMFCDLVGSTELAQRLGADELAVAVGEYQNTCARVVRGFNGHIAQYLGDGVLVYFGYPQAYEDDAIRAVNCALEILAAIPVLNAQMAEQLPALAGKAIEVRIGIHSGMVVLSDMGRGDEQPRLALGDTLNIAARLQSEAEAGVIVISEATRRLVHGAFVLDDLGSAQLKGVAAPVETYRVVARSGAQSRLERYAEAGLTPLVGREQEIALALDRWEQTVEGSGQVVLLSGDPGIGKSRLVAVVRERLADEPHTWLACRCSAYHENSAFHPVIALLERAAGVEDGDSESRRRDKLESALRAAEMPARHIPPLVDLLSVSARHPEGSLLEPGEDPRMQTLESLAACLFQLSTARPLVLVVEDINWADPSTLELLRILIARVSTKRVLLLFTFRPEFDVPWAAGGHLVRIGLHPLTRDQIAKLCTAVAGGRTLPEAVLSELVAKADGVPLFAEELTKTILEAEWLVEREGRLQLAGPPRVLPIPSTLHESLMARLDGLGPTKELAQLCAVIGRDVSYELLRAVSQQPQAELQSGLLRLVAANLLAREEVPGQAPYVFRHALIHETAYDSLLRSDRQQLHARIARVLEEQFPERSAARPEDLARHYERAGLFKSAVRFYRRAANQAVIRLAHAEAIAHLKRGIELVGLFPESADRDRTELDLQMALGTSTMIAEGQGHPEVETTHARARDLSEKLADPNGLFRALWGLSRFQQSHGRLGVSYELGEQLRDLARKSDDPSLHRWAHLALGQALFWRGDPARSLEELEATVAVVDATPESPEVHLFGQDPALTSRALVGPALWILGRPDRARQKCREAREIGKKAGDPFTYAMVLGFAATVHQLCGEREITRELAEAAIEIASERGFPLLLGFGRVMKGWALTADVVDEGGIAEMRQGLLDLAGTGTGVGGPYLIALLADALRRAGRDGEALGATDSALDLGAQQQSRFWDADLLRLKGEILLGLEPDAVAESERLLRQALEVAVEQNARSFELRAAMSLYRLRCERGESAAELALVRDVYRRFDEGFDTRDLMEARELLSDAQ